MSQFTKRVISISDEGGLSLNFIIEEQQLSLNTLKVYFLNARGLSYLKNGKINKILPNDNYLELDVGVNAYHVLYFTGMHINCT